MGEILNLIGCIHKNKELFPELVEQMKPVINKYTRLLYKDEQEDVRSELVLALWEAVTKLNYVTNEGQCVRFIATALKTNFMNCIGTVKNFMTINLVRNRKYWKMKFVKIRNMVILLPRLI